MNIRQRCVNSFRGLRQIGLAWLAAALLLPVAAYAQDSGSITGRVVAEDGKTLANVRVFLSSSGATPSRSVSRSTYTDEDGNFQFNNLPNRSYVVSATGQKGYIVKSRSAEEQSQTRFHPG